MNIREHLQAAKENGELIAIVYYGGSHPGEARRIYPIKVTETDVWGREENGARAKCFKLNKIEIAACDAVIHDFSISSPQQEPETLKQALAPYFSDVESSPWGIERNEESIEIYDYFKNGKRRKSPRLSLRYSEPTPSQIVVTWSQSDGMKVDSQLTGFEKPWCVRSQRSTWNFKKLSSAIQRFMEEFRAIPSPD